MFRTKKSQSWFDKGFDAPDDEDIAMSLEATASLVLTIWCNNFDTNENHICSSKILNILSRDDYNGHTTEQAHLFLRNYSVMSDLIDMVYNRVKEAAKALDSRECRSLRNIETFAPHSGAIYKIRRLLKLAEYVTLPEEYDQIGYDVIETVKANTPEQNDVPIIAARYLMRIAYLLYCEKIYEATPDKTEAEPDAVDDSQEDDSNECEEGEEDGAE